MINNRTLAVLLAVALLAPAAARADDAAPPFAADIAAFEAADRVQAPPEGAVLFVGSSSVRFWESLAEDFPGLTVIDRGFGGSTIADCARYADRIVTPYRPRRVVFYAGDNDVAAGLAPERILADFKSFAAKARAGQPDLPILFVSIKPSLARWNLIETIRRTNALIQAYAAANKIEYADVTAAMLGADGKPRPELFREDGLHMTRGGYDIWTRLIDPFARAGGTFPPLKAETLEKRPVSLPGDFEGERNLLFVAFKHKQQDEVDTWASRAKDFASLDAGLRVYEVPTIKKLSKMTRWFITSGMRGGIHDAGARDRTITLFIDKEPFKNSLQVRDEQTIHVLVVNRAGELLWRASGAYDEAKGKALRAFLGRAAAAKTP